MSIQYPRGSGRTAKPPASIKPGLEFELTPTPDTKVTRRNNQVEWGEQCTYFDQVNARLCPKPLADGIFIALPDFPGADMIYAIPNSNVAGENVGKKLVQSGLRRGYPDINVDVPRTVRGHVYHGLRIELKQPQGVPSDVQDHQDHWHEKLREQGYRVCVCFGWREAWAVTCDYLGWKG